MKRDELVQELRYSLPSKRILEVAKNIAYLDESGDVIVLKSREQYFNPFKTHERIFISDFSNYSRVDDFEELHGVNLIISKDCFNSRGKNALNQFYSN